jgi:hypothetical protein
MFELFKRPEPQWDQKIFTIPKDDEGKSSERIRCPRCEWQPAPTSTWCCHVEGSPEPPFSACGTIWNTFDTHGRCPGCSHQWTWTSCLRCGEFSLHEDWYECE